MRTVYQRHRGISRSTKLKCNNFSKQNLKRILAVLIFCFFLSSPWQRTRSTRYCQQPLFHAAASKQSRQWIRNTEEALLLPQREPNSQEEERWNQRIQLHIHNLLAWGLSQQFLKIYQLIPHCNEQLVHWITPQYWIHCSRLNLNAIWRRCEYKLVFVTFDKNPPRGRVLQQSRKREL